MKELGGVDARRGRSSIWISEAHSAELGDESVVATRCEVQRRALKKEVGEWTGDKASTTAELSAVVEYLSKLNDMCFAKAEPDAETVRRRTAEIARLKEALSIL